MRINPEEINHIEEAGELDGNPVKMIRTKGGFWLAVGRVGGRGVDTALGAGSHPAIVRYHVEKQFPNFRPSMMKSVLFNDDTKVEKFTHLLPADLQKSGHDLYTIQKGHEIEFQMTKQNMKVAGLRLNQLDKKLSDMLVTPELRDPFFNGIATIASSWKK